ncbi:PTS sugar transporter subunit IIA [Thermodesulfobacteriota bacterium]
MIGTVLVTHPGLGEAFVNAIEYICGSTDWIRTVPIDIREDAETARSRIMENVNAVDRGHGVLIITDMFGGTPSNIALSLLEEGRIEVLTGLNLAMLMKLATGPETESLGDLAVLLRKCGREDIRLASHVIRSRKGDLPKE